MVWSVCRCCSALYVLATVAQRATVRPVEKAPEPRATTRFRAYPGELKLPAQAQGRSSIAASRYAMTAVIRIKFPLVKMKIKAQR